MRARFATAAALGLLALPALAGAGVTIKVSECANVSVPTVNGDGVTARVRVPDSAAGTVRDVNVGVRMTHAFPSELTLSLSSPQGTSVLLAFRAGPSGSDYGTGGTGCGADFAVFDDEAASSIYLADAPFSGSHQPDGDLSDFDGENPAGRWRLSVFDAGIENKGSGVTGTIEALKIRARVRP